MRRSPICSSSSPVPGPPTPTGRGSRGVPGACATRRVEIGSGRQDGPGGRLDVGRELHRRPRRPRHQSAAAWTSATRGRPTSLARGRIHIAALAVGSAQRALDESVAYAVRHQGGTRSATSNWCRPCSPTSRPACSRAGRWCATRPEAPRRGPQDRPVGGETVLHRMAGKVADWRCRCTAARAACAVSRSSGSTGRCACCVLYGAPAKSSG